MDYKMNLLLLIVAIVPLLHSQPIDEQPSKGENVSPVAKNQDKNDSSDESTTDGTYVEETYIEVLLPGVPQVNSSFLKSLLNSSSASSTDSKNDKNSESASTEKPDSDERVKREQENKKSPLASFQDRRDSTVLAPKNELNEEQSTKNPIRVARDTSDKNATPQNPSSTKSVVNENKKSPLVSFQAGRHSTVSGPKKDLNEEQSTKNANRAARDISDKNATPQNPSSTKSDIDENKKSSLTNFQAGRDGTVLAPKKELNEGQSTKYPNRSVRDVSDENAATQNPSSTESVIDENKKSSLASFQAARDSTVLAPKKELNEEQSTKNPNRAVRDVSDKDATTQKPSTTESVVYITPQGSKTRPQEAHATYY